MTLLPSCITMLHDWFKKHATLPSYREARWPHGKCTRLRSERSGFEPWPGILCCVLWQDTICSILSGGAVASWLVHSAPERAVRVLALAGDTVLCSLARHFICSHSASLHPVLSINFSAAFLPSEIVIV